MPSIEAKAAQPFIEALSEDDGKTDFQKFASRAAAATGLRPADLDTAITQPKKVAYLEQTVRATNPDYELPRCVEIDADAAYASRACMAGRKGMKGAMGKMPFSSKGGYRPIGLPTAKPLHARPGGLRRLRGGRGFGGRARPPIK